MLHMASLLYEALKMEFVIILSKAPFPQLLYLQVESEADGEAHK